MSAPNWPRIAPVVVLLAIAIATGVAPTPVSAQAVIVTLVEAESPRPLVGALVRLRDASGSVVRSGLTDERGRLALLGLAAGEYRLDAQMIGRESRVGEPVSIAATGTVERTIALTSRALELAGLTVEGATRCQVRPSDDDAVQRVWEETRKALEATALVQAAGALRYELESVEREVAGDGEVVRDRRARVSGRYREPYRSLEPEELSRNGFVRFVGDDSLAVAPDARVLLSDAFLDTHCFRIAEGGEPGLVGLAFEPVRTRSVPDIEGVLWLSRATAALRSVEFRYRGGSFERLPEETVGSVDFERLPTGAWVVRRWRLRFPLLEEGERRLGDRRAPTLRATGSLEVGGEVIRVLDQEGTPVVVADRAALAGTIHDSIAGGPLTGATVTLAGTGWGATTDDAGRFAIADLPGGRYTLVTQHPVLDSIGAPMPEGPVALEPGRTLWLELAVAPATAPEPGAVAGVRGRLSTDAGPPPAVVLVSDAGEEVGRALPDVHGDFTLPAPGPGRYVVLAEEPGRATVSGAPFALAEGQTRFFLHSGRGVPVTLPVPPETSVGVCSPLDPRTPHAAVWAEAAKALSAVRWSRAGDRVAHRIALYTRVRAPRTGEILDEDAWPVPNVVAPHFPEAAALDLAVHGFVRRPEKSDSAAVFAPLPAVLLSEPFVRTHCYRLVPSAWSPPGKVGLSFRAIDRDAERADVEGVLWLDAATGMLETLDYRYTSMPDAPHIDGGGWIDFARLEDGGWTIVSWGSRLPVIAEITAMGPRSGLDVAGVWRVHEDGGVARPVGSAGSDEPFDWQGRVPSALATNALWDRATLALFGPEALSRGGGAR